MARDDFVDECEATEQSPLLTARPDVPVAETAAAAAGEDAQVVDKGRISVSRLRGFAIASAIGILVFMQTSNVSLITTIQSSIAAEFDAYAQVSWFTSAYLITMASVPAIAGRFCELFSPQGYVLVSSTIFALGVLITSMASTFNWFLVGRAITGVGVAGNFPAGLIIIIKLTGVKRRGLFMGLLNTGFTFGLGLGAVIAGALEPVVGWRAVFWLQIPFILAAGLGLFFAMPQDAETEETMTRASVSQKLGSVDYLGVLTLFASVVLLLFSLSSPRITVVPIVLSLVFFIAFLVVEARFASTPIIPISVIRSRGTLFTSLATLGMMMSRYLILLYTPVYFMTVRSWTPVHAGLSLIAVNGGFAVGGLIVGWIHIRRAGSYFTACAVTYALFTVVYFLTSALSTSATPVPVYLALVFVSGCMTGASLNYCLVHLLHLTPHSYHFIATSVTAMFRGLGGSFGSGIGGGIFVRILKSALESEFGKRGMLGEDELIKELLGSPRMVAKLTSPEKDVAVIAYTAALQGLLFAGAMIALVATLCQLSTGWKAAPLEESDKTDDNVVS